MAPARRVVSEAALSPLHQRALAASDPSTSLRGMPSLSAAAVFNGRPTHPRRNKQSGTLQRRSSRPD